LIVLRWELTELEEANAQLAEQLRVALESKDIRDNLPTPAQKHMASTQTDYTLTSVRSQFDGHQTDDGEEDQIREQKSTSGESSDSGTAVNDLEEDEEEELSVPKPRGRLRSNSTRTIESTSRFNERPASALSEAQVFQHRNEVRRLRTRISTLEKKNRVNQRCCALNTRFLGVDHGIRISKTTYPPPPSTEPRPKRRD
jgi:hypothetical protein